MTTFKLTIISTMFLLFSFLGNNEVKGIESLSCPPECDIVGEIINGYCRPSGNGTRCYRDPLYPDQNPSCNGTYIPLSCS